MGLRPTRENENLLASPTQERAMACPAIADGAVALHPISAYSQFCNEKLL